jgi:hypothetical protein
MFFDIDLLEINTQSEFECQYDPRNMSSVNANVRVAFLSIDIEAATAQRQSKATINSNKLSKYHSGQSEQFDHISTQDFATQRRVMAIPMQ